MSEIPEEKRPTCSCGEIKSKFSPYYITNYLLQTLYTEKRHLDLLELDRLGCDR